MIFRRDKDGAYGLARNYEREIQFLQEELNKWRALAQRLLDEKYSLKRTKGTDYGYKPRERSKHEPYEGR